ncbi:hypothetical protein VTK73DRAFT_324 [Phialemonium thermophilum]|uniref:DNA polymerase V n=1 Tax=Phialemonium thermophilum TaxID=223376 RepID=A0ABR3VVQ9_9PEZI
MIFQKMVEGGEKAPFILENVFSKNLMVCLMNQAAKEDRYLHRAALKALKTIETAVQQNPSLLPLVLRQLLGPRGAYNFDLRTNTKTVDKLLQSTNSENAGEVLEILKGCNNLEASQSLQTYSGYLSRIASLPTDVELADGETRVPAAVRALQEMSKLTYSKAGSDAVAGKIRDMLRSKLTAAFAKLVRRPEDFAHLCRAVLSIKADHDMDEEIESELRRASERLADLLDREHVELGLRAPYQGLALLHAVGILQLHNEEPDAVDTLADLDQCYEKLKSNALKDDDGISEFLVEILLSMVAQPSSLMRQVSQQVFEAFTPLLSEQAIQLLLDPLEAEESSKGQQALFSTEDEDMNGDGEEGSDGSDPESLDSDVEMVDIEGAPSEDGSEGTDDSSDEAEEEEEEEEDGDKEEMQAFDDALAKVLKTRRLDAQDQEAAAAADDSDSDSDSDMSDSEMMALDDKIAEVFRQRTKQARKGRDRRDAKASVVNFKHRVLDLLAIFVRREAASANPLVFRVLLPLLRLVRTTTVRPLAGKACELVLTFGKSLKKARSVGAEQDKAKKEQEEQEQAQSGKEKDKKKKKKKDKKDKNKKSQEEDVGGKAGLDADDLLALLAEIHTEAALDQSHVLARAASAASLAVASVLLDGTGPWTAVARQGIDEDVFRLYAGTQLRWFRGEIKMQASFFSDWLNWCQSHASASAAKTAAVKE